MRSAGARPDIAPGLAERDGELRRVTLAVERATHGLGSLLVVEGPAGIGKSRLLAAACAIASEQDLQILQARGGTLERDLAYGAIRLLLERPLAALDVAARQEVMGGAAALAAPALAIAGVEQLAPADRGFAVEHGLFWCVANLAQRRPLLLALDDAHWFDAPSLRFLLYLARRVADLPVAIIVATRDDEPGPEPVLVARLTVEPDAEILRPQPLTAPGVAAVLSEQLQVTVAPDFGDACHSASGGNPFLLTELAATLRADGIRPTAAAAARVCDVRPRTLSRAILLRLARMPAGALELATAVAVLGAGAGLDLAAALANLGRPEAAEALDRLCAAQILVPAMELEFVHPIVREAVYGDLGPAQREHWHARAAELILERGAPVERAALHLLLTGPCAQASSVQTLRRAARGALDRGAPDIAARYLERALAEPPPEPERAATLLELGAAGFLAGDPIEQPKAHLREAIALLDEPGTRAEAWLLLARVTAMDRSVPGAVAVLEEALEDLGELDGERRLRLETELGALAMTHPDTAARAAARVDSLRPPEGRTPAERLALCNLAARNCFTVRSAAQSARLTERAVADGWLVADEGADNNAAYQVI